MSFTYRPQIRSISAYLGLGIERLTAPGLIQELGRIESCQLAGTCADDYELEIGMVRNSHADALDEITYALARFGLEYAEAVVSDWARLTVKGAVSGLILGAGASGRSRDPNVIAVASGVGTIVGGLAGSLLRQEVGRYIARRNPWSGVWRIESSALPGGSSLRLAAL